MAVVRPADAALIGPLPWELPYAAPVALKGQKEKEKRKEDEKISAGSATQSTCSVWAAPGD